MAAKPTPSVMPRKYFPSRVNFSLRGGRKRRTRRRHSVFGGGPSKRAASERREERGSDFGGLAASDGSVRGTGSVAIAPRFSERHGDAGDDFAHGPFGFVS